MKQTAAEIDHAILDVAAGIFASRGFAHTSVQQVADAVGYSKPGLLHRFGCKEAMHSGVMTEVEETVDRLAGRSHALSGHPDRVPLVLESLFRAALDRPGVAAMMVAGMEPSGQLVPEQAPAAGMRMVELFDVPPSSPVRRLRIVLALRLIANAAATQRGGAGLGTHLDLHVPTEDLVPMVVGLALSTMRGGAGMEHDAVLSSMAGRLSASR